jgi:hypothetical protein
VNARLLFLIAAVVCLVIALLMALAVIHGDHEAWLDGGLLSFVLSFLPVPSRIP